MYWGIPAACTRKMSGGLPAAYIAYSRVRSASTSSISIFVVSCNRLRSSSPNSCESVMTTTFAGPLFFDVGCCWQATASGATAAAAATAPAPARRRLRVVRSCPWGAFRLGFVSALMGAPSHGPRGARSDVTGNIRHIFHSSRGLVQEFRDKVPNNGQRARRTTGNDPRRRARRACVPPDRFPRDQRAEHRQRGNAGARCQRHPGAALRAERGGAQPVLEPHAHARDGDDGRQRSLLRRGGREATAYLLSQGHRRIATITGPLDWPSARARLDGYRDALRKSDGESSQLVEPSVDWGLESGRRAGLRLLEAKQKPTAIF